MPYRAMLATIVTVALALLALGMWLRGVEPALQQAQKYDEIAKVSPPTQPITRPATEPAESTKARWVVQLTMLLAFVLICMLLLVGFFATFREWVRYGGRGRIRRRQKTQYVDAWKIAGERLDVPGDKSPPADEPPAS
jgi:hypothetical protein